MSRKRKGKPGRPRRPKKPRVYRGTACLSTIDKILMDYYLPAFTAQENAFIKLLESEQD